MPECREQIMSEEYADFIGEFGIDEEVLNERYTDFCPQIINYRYLSLYERLDGIAPIGLQNYPYSSIPKLFGLMDTTAVAATGAIRMQNQTGFQLKGQNVIVGFIDTGIDYTNDVFKTGTGQSRILEIWDQTDNTGNTPDGFAYGSVYNNDDINRALNSSNPFDIVPHRDTNGHGTAMAGAACGSYDEQMDFVGAAPESMIAMVKLKPAKQYLKDFFFINGGEPVYQENDIMLAVSYLLQLKRRYEKPIVIVLGIGSGSGGRTGGSPLSQLLMETGQIIGNCVVVCSGNEGNERLHYGGTLTDGEFQDVELRVGADNSGFVLELWGNSPDVFSVSFVSPLGESVPRIPARKDNHETLDFLLEGTRIEVDYRLVESGVGGELVFMRFVNPSEGVWIIRVYGSNILSGRFNIWANLRQFTDIDTYFLKPDPDTTITIPGNAENVITTGGYNHVNNSLYPSTGRGFSRDDRIKPDFVAPSVNVYVPDLNHGFKRMTGTSVGAALTAGCCAQMLEWGVVEGNDVYMKTNYIKNYLIRGAVRDRDIVYPNRQWGYGKVNVFESFVIMTRT